jgi:hypothetical protein
MDIGSLCTTLQAQLADGPIPHDGFARFLDCYKQYRIDRCLADDDGDVLVFQWGTYDWGDGEQFEVSLTRELLTAVGDGEEDVRQVALAYRFEPTRELEQLGDGELWCDDPGSADRFWAKVQKTKPYLAVAHRTDAEMELGEGEA